MDSALANCMYVCAPAHTHALPQPLLAWRALTSTIIGACMSDMCTILRILAKNVRMCLYLRIRTSHMQVMQTSRTRLTCFRTRWTCFRTKWLTWRTNWTHFRTQLKQALGNTITRWWSYYRTPAAVRMVRSSLIPRPPHCKTMGGAGTFIKCTPSRVDTCQTYLVLRKNCIWQQTLHLTHICQNGGRTNQIYSSVDWARLLLYLAIFGHCQAVVLSYQCSEKEI